MLSESSSEIWAVKLMRAVVTSINMHASNLVVLVMSSGCNEERQDRHSNTRVEFHCRTRSLIFGSFIIVIIIVCRLVLVCWEFEDVPNIFCFLWKKSWGLGLWVNFEDTLRVKLNNFGWGSQAMVPKTDVFTFGGNPKRTQRCGESGLP